jgi:hypothetical protein
MINVDNNSHPMVQAANTQGSNTMLHFTAGNSGNGSGIIIGGGGGASAGIVGPAGENPNTPTIGGDGGATAGIVGPGVLNLIPVR